MNSGAPTVAGVSKILDCNMIIKRGAAGCCANIDGEFYNIPGISVDAKDTCGAGDAFLAAYLSSPFEEEVDKLEDANEYAAWSCTFEGTQTPTTTECEKWSKRWAILR